MSRIGSVKIGAHRYRVLYRKDIANSDNFTRAGQCDYMATEISVSTHTPNGKTRSPSQVGETIIHEIVHAVGNDRHLDLSEHEVDQLGAGLHAAIVDNPKLFGTHFIEQWK
jgi:hypothetical protein